MTTELIRSPLHILKCPSVLSLSLIHISIENARKIVTCNPVLAHKIDLRLQKDNRRIFDGIIAPDEYFDVTICNPPFHSSKEEAEELSLIHIFVCVLSVVR